jgi:hypothetical protein
MHNEELHNLYSSPNLIRTIKPRKMRMPGHVARMAQKRNVCWESQKEMDRYKDLDVGERLILKWFLKK